MRFGAVAALAVALAALTACGGPTETEPEVPGMEVHGRVPIPVPVLDDMKDDVRESLEGARAEVDALAARADVDPVKLAGAYRDLGNRYQINKLRDAAKACYRNAEALDRGDFATLYFLGMILQDNGLYDEAIATYDEALAVRGDYVPALLRIAEAWLRKNEPERARPLLERVTSHADYRAAGHYGLGRVEAAAGNHAEAVTHFETALELQPGATKIHYPLGLAYRSLGRRSEAETHLEAYGQVEVGFPDPVLGRLSGAATGVVAHLQAANHALIRGEYEEAEREYREVLAVEPDHVESRRSLGLALWRLGDLDGAIEQYRIAVQLDPSDSQNPYSLGILLAENGLWAEAIPQLEATVAIDPEFVRAHLSLADAYRGTGRLETALDRYRKVLEIDPRSRAALFGEAALLDELGRLDEAASRLRAMLAADPTDAEAMVDLAAVLSQAGRLEEAIEILIQARNLRPPAPVLALVHHNLGVTHARRGEWSEAVEDYRRAMELDPTLIDSRLHLAGILGRQGRLAESVVLFEGILEDDPGNHAARLTHGTALVLLERYHDARVVLERGLKVAPGQPDLTHALAKLLATCPDDAVRDGDRALELALAAYRHRQGIEQAETVAMAYAEVGSFADAVKWQRDVLERAEKLNRPELLDQFRRNMARYESGEPCRAPWNAGS